MRGFHMLAILLSLLLCLACTPAVAPASTDASAVSPAPTDAPAVTAGTDPAPAQTDAGAAESRFAPLYAQMLALDVLPDMMPLPADMVADFYGIASADCADGLFFLSYDSLLADEIVLVLAADDAAAKRIETALNNRLAAKAAEAESYAPTQHAVIQNCRVLRKGLSVAMLVSPSFDALSDLFEQAA